MNASHIARQETGQRETEKRAVLLVDDHPVVCEGLTERINREPDFTVCAVAQTGSAALAAILRCQPDIVVLDLALPRNHGLEVLRDIRQQFPKLPVLIFSMHEETVYAERVLRSGARGYIMKHQPPERLLEGMRNVLRGNYALSPEAASRLLSSFSQPVTSQLESPTDCLGNRELEVFQFLGQGKGTREIAGLLGLSVKTVETYRGRLKEKFKITSAPELMRLAVRWVETGV